MVPSKKLRCPGYRRLGCRRAVGRHLVGQLAIGVNSAWTAASGRILEVSVSDPETFGDLSQFAGSRSMHDGKLLILQGEMLERSIRHAWKANSSSDTKQLRSGSTHT
jgi:hypothetical protein